MTRSMVAPRCPWPRRLPDRCPATTEPATFCSSQRQNSTTTGTCAWAWSLFVAVAVDAWLIARERGAVQDRIVREFPELFKDRRVDGQRRQRERIGEAFELDFAYAITGRPVSIKALRGNVVVVDFWAAYGGEVAGHFPTMKRLYAQYHDKGVEFIGVSLDLAEEDGGLDALKAFVAREQITWPQYYDDLQPHRATFRPRSTYRIASARYYECLGHTRIMPRTAAGDFAVSWGISLLPTVFLIDADGKLYSTEAQGELETLIPRLLAKSNGASAGK
jgi:thiol-disulfide isomerase/thioredoxin